MIDWVGRMHVYIYIYIYIYEYLYEYVCVYANITQSLVRSLELIQQQHEQSDVSSRQEKQEVEAQFMHERNFSSQQIVKLQGEVTTCRDATTRVQTLLEEARQRGEEEKRASVVALEKLRNETALVRHLVCCSVCCSACCRVCCSVCCGACCRACCRVFCSMHWCSILCVAVCVAVRIAVCVTV